MTLIFDLDGTLLDTLQDLNHAVNHSLKKFGFPAISLDETRKFVGNGLKSLISLSLPKGAQAQVDSVLAEMKLYYADHCCEATHPYCGISELLKELKHDGHPIAIVSNKANAMVQTLRQKFFSDTVDFALGETPELRRKPFPDMVFAAMDALGSEAIYIGDSEVDIQTAKNASLPALIVAWGFREEEALLAAGAEKVCHSPAELHRAIEMLAKHNRI